MKCTIKRRGHEEKFDERKVYASCYAACLSAGIEHIESEKICEKVSRDVKKWIKEKTRTSSDQIFKKTKTLMKKYDKKASFMYETHRDIN
jgi:transcriptional regulator NrdR family protein